MGGIIIIDVHCHLDFKDFNRNREEVIERARSKLRAVIDSGVGLGGNRRALELASLNPGFIYPTMGFHPVDASKARQDLIGEVVSQIESNIDLIVAVGETGMDFHHTRDEEGRRRQEETFRVFVELAAEHEMPLVVHARDAEERALETVLEYRVPEVIFHCYGGSIETARRILDEGYYISISTLVAFSEHHMELVRAIPLEGMLTETDSPYLSPFRGKRNEPAFVEEAVRAIARIKDMDLEDVDSITTANAERVFGL
ncbi:MULTISPECIES: TatD family hydrolase [Methanothermobacter]|jgi:TatD DNase family protein|uniref:TatD DNase family protein n=2 Tax=Methanothermobacter TaxID=145260 RepID=A0A371NF13_9EURY|nr:MULTISPECIES: TatD family hydrolase [Methanothermobacter]MDK2875406.1 TatD DNase family protein [Methanothermobacter sp.]MDN5373612.1 TatD DNase family protein [Methanothermobacter sp.]REE29081.1 TatD DNase family protein [Methanothermobacter defluvii]WBF08346.1 TatD family hydrolase [Methanothermobacter thermautotrophicus]BAZ98288.1 D-aminoacyl-tRNA deacylase [Methanothermobacter sp. EMTCatA1]